MEVPLFREQFVVGLVRGGRRERQGEKARSLAGLRTEPNGSGWVGMTPRVETPLTSNVIYSGRVAVGSRIKL